MQNLFGYSRVLAIGDVRGNYNNLIGDYAESWLENGGFETLRQLDNLAADAKEELVQWVMNLPVKYKYQEFFFCHAGVDPDVTLSVQTEFDMLWRRQQWWEQYRGRKLSWLAIRRCRR